jgi:glycosyltransferase involved in cell wall biosynthesis
MGLSIGIVAHGWHPDIGGVESHTRDLARELGTRGHRVAALAVDLASEAEPYSIREEQQEDVRVTRMAYRYHDHRALADLVHNPHTTRVLLDWVTRGGFDLVHVHHASGWTLAALPALAAQGPPTVMTLHDYWPLCPRGQMLRTDGEVCATAEAARCAPCLAHTWPWLTPSSGGEPRGPRGEVVEGDEAAAGARTSYALECLRSAARLFTPSAAAREVYVRAGLGEESIEVVENGIEVEGLAREVERLRRAEPRAGAARAELRLGLLGTVLPSKGALELARAVLAADVPGLVLDVHGNLPSYHGDTSYLEALKALAASDARIRVHGPFPHDGLARILASVDGVAAPSRWNEVYGLTVREARAAGLPVLVSAAGALPDVVSWGAAGLVVPVDDHAAWVAAVKRFGDPDQRARWSKPTDPPRGARAMTLQLERAYVEVLASRGRVPRLAFEPGEERTRAGGPLTWLRRLWGR